MDKKDNDNKGKAKGGNARAEKLSPDRRKEIAQKAANARWQADIPKAQYVGILKIAAEIRGVIELGDRVIRVIVQRGCRSFDW